MNILMTPCSLVVRFLAVLSFSTVIFVTDTPGTSALVFAQEFTPVEPEQKDSREMTPAESEPKGEVRSFLIQSEQDIVRAYAVVIFEPEVRSLPPVGVGIEAIQPVVPSMAQRAAGFRRIDSRFWEVIVPLAVEDVRPKAKISAFAVTTDGQLLSTPVQWVIANSLVDNVDQLSEVRCEWLEELPQLTKFSNMQPADLERLVEIRRRRRDLMRKLVREGIDVNFSRTVAKAEKQFGLGSKPRITRKTPITELSDRLLALVAVSQ